MDELERRLRTANLNLLPILMAVLKHRNLTRAALELNITQSGVSNSLKQLRAHFGDELLVRDGRRLCLTEKAKQLLDPLERALVAVGQVLANEPFTPVTSARHFRVATADYVTAITAPEMAALMRKEAPKVTVQMITARGRSGGDLRAGDIDMIISPRQIIEAVIYGVTQFGTEIVVESLAREPFVCLARKDNREFAKGLTPKRYFELAHASFHLDLTAHASLECGYLIENNLTQFNRILTSDFSVLPLIAARSDCIVLVPRSVARMATRYLPLRVGPSPIPVPDLDLVMVLMKRRYDDPDLRWLRELTKRSIAKSLT